MRESDGKAYQNAMRRRTELRQELEQIEQFLQLYQTFSQKAERRESRAVEVEVISGMDLVPYIRKAVLDVGRPLARGELIGALAESGIGVGGKDPATNVGTVLWRAKSEFINLKRHGYWPRDVAYPLAGYDPAQAAG